MRLSRYMKAGLLRLYAVVAIIVLGAVMLLVIVTDDEDTSPSPFDPHEAAVNTLRGEYEAVADLEFASGLATGPDGRIYAAEFRSGDIKVLTDDGSGGFDVEDFAHVPLPDVITNEQGLWHLVVDPEGSFLYASAINETGRNPSWHIVRFAINEDGTAGPLEEICGGMRGGLVHNGGAMIFGSDGMLYVSVGEAVLPAITGNVRHLMARGTSTVSDFSNITGVIIRIDPEGCLQEPVNISDFVIATGFRNVYGLAFGPDGRLYAADNGPACCDRIFPVELGGDHGWPRLGLTANDLEAFRRTDDVAVPLMFSQNQQLGVTQMIYLDGGIYGEELSRSLIYGTYHAGALMRVELAPDGVTAAFEEVLVRLDVEQTPQYREEGGINSVITGPDGYIYFSSLTKLYRLNEVEPLGEP